MYYLEIINTPPKDTFNHGLSSPDNNDMIELLGYPREDGKYSSVGDCSELNNPNLSNMMEIKNVGPFKATGLKPALSSLTIILSQVKNQYPDLYAVLHSEGMLCARYTKINQPDGSIKIGPNLSNHSWGTAIDINIDGVLDEQGSNTVQKGLWILASFFNANGWYWGAGFKTEDGMHFEVSLNLLQQWKDEGIL
jgi:hypothetical protein